METNIKLLTPEDAALFKELIGIFALVFEIQDFQPPQEHHLATLLQHPGLLVFAAMHDGKIIGGATVYVLPGYYSEKPMANIYDIGILPAFQRMGVGKKLIGKIIEYCQEKSFRDVFVSAEADDSQAVSFYRVTRFTGETKAVFFDYRF